MAALPPRTVLWTSSDPTSFAGGLLVSLAVLVLGGLGVWLDIVIASAAFSGGGSSRAASKVNCPSCGARTTTDRATCGYCEEPLPADEPRGP